VTAEPVHFIAADGTVLDERSGPIRHYINAKPATEDAGADRSTK
jgi:hypothetical protein